MDTKSGPHQFERDRSLEQGFETEPSAAYVEQGIRQAEQYANQAPRPQPTAEQRRNPQHELFFTTITDIQNWRREALERTQQAQHLRLPGISGLVQKTTKVFSAGAVAQRMERQYVRQEAEAGGQVFADDPAGRYREFFPHKNEWVYHQYTTDRRGRKQEREQATRIFVGPSGEFVASDAGQIEHKVLRGRDLTNTLQAVANARLQIGRNVYHKSVQ